MFEVLVTDTLHNVRDCILWYASQVVVCVRLNIFHMGVAYADVRGSWYANYRTSADVCKDEQYRALG